MKRFETGFMVANDDLEGKTTHFTGFYTHTISGSNIPKPPIVYMGWMKKSQNQVLLLVHVFHMIRHIEKSGWTCLIFIAKSIPKLTWQKIFKIKAARTIPKLI